VIVHLVMGGGILVAGYRGPRSYDNARRHAQCVTGADVVPFDLATLPDVMRAIVEAELKSELPDDIVRDIELSEWEEDEDVTPVEAVDIEIDDY
jgi:hypothetical protein